MQNSRVIHLDCTLRDGGYYNNWDFSVDLIEEYLIAVKSAGIDVAEIGFRFWSNNGFKGGCAYATDEFLEMLDIPDGLTIAVMLNAADICVNGTLDMGRLKKLVLQRAEDSPVDMVRIASHGHEFRATLEACKWLKKRGYTVGANIMQISEYTEAEIKDFALLAADYPLEVLYFADSLGSLTPDKISDVINTLRLHWSGAIGIHAHDNLMMALANSLQALQDGAVWIDSTITGMGRGPGNLRTEEFILETETREGATYSLLPLLRLVRTVFNPLKIKHGWGTNPFYYMAGKYSIHPTYIQEILKDTQYDEEDILSVINHLKSIDGARFDFNTLESAKNFYEGPPRGTWAPNSVLKNKKVLLIGTGPSVEMHIKAIEAYIKREQPIVLVVNTPQYIASDLIHYRIACHPIRLLADANKHLELSQPLITPWSMLPQTVQGVLGQKKICDYGLGIQAEQFVFHEMSCIAPSSNILAYALSVIHSGQAKEIILAGFDGYPRKSERNQEVDKIFNLFRQASDIDLYSITPTIYETKQKSVYAI